MIERKRKSKLNSALSISDSESTATSISTVEIEAIIDQLCMQQHRDSTKQNYYCVWKLFNSFFIKLDVKPVSWEERLTLFVGYLASQQKKSTTIRSYISAIKAVLTRHKMEFNEDRVLLNALTKACKVQHDVIHTKLPFRCNLLHLLFKAIEDMYAAQPYLECLYKAMLSTAYYGLLRISEYTQTDAGHAVKVGNVQIGVNKDKFMLILNVKPQIIKIDALNDSTKENKYCPFKLFKDYQQIRKRYKSLEENFFIFKDRSPVSDAQFRRVLAKAIEWNKLNPSLYSSQAIRTGRVTDLIEMGVSIETIKKLGRWKSTSIYTYLRH